MERDNFKKAIIFDCDNTLWDGIVGEGSIKAREEYQTEIVNLANHGVIIGLCSKNNEEDVLNALKSQILTEDYISVKRINWKDKATNIKEIARELNIGLDAIVFVDDSPFEINLVRSQAPEVLSIYPPQLKETVDQWFNLLGNITKTNQYKENYERMRAEEKFTDINDYLASLDMVLTIKRNEESHIARISEMTQKTNQFNLTTLRMTEEQVKGLLPWIDIYTLSVKDKYGDHGITGVCMVLNNQITNYLLSCRILGKGIEYAFMDYVIADLFSRNNWYVFGRYIPSEKNKQTELFYPKIGFKFEYQNVNGVIYYIDIPEYKPMAANHFRYE